MCGIFCAICKSATDPTCQLSTELRQLLHNRGPDVGGEVVHDNVVLAGNVLWQQGVKPQAQPIGGSEWVLLFNGDLFNLENEKPAEQSDSAWLLHMLQESNDEQQLVALLRRLQGPYCLILYNRQRRMLYFCRDALGRNSLIIEQRTQCIRLLSTSCHMEGQQRAVALELPPLGLYRLQLDDLDSCVLYPWQSLGSHHQEQLHQLNALMHWSTRVEEPIAPDWLFHSVTAPPADATFDLYELVDATADLEQNYARLLENAAILETLHSFDKLLQHSVEQRVRHTAPICRNCAAACGKCSHAKTCLLFSGGIDCSILALLADRFVPPGEPIELINVAFERVAGGSCDWNVPDRQTAQQSHAELQQLCPHRDWRLLEVNVTREQLKRQLSQHIRHLIYPLSTVLDECLGCAFWFAAASPTSTARVALLGSGADELFGGYTRHRNAYRRATGQTSRLDALHLELELDWQRIPGRNLARDDRVIADSGKTARAPFIEEHVAQFVRSLAPQQRCCYALPEGVGDKLLLRLYGYSLGLRDAVLLKKRAIQFGSRIADKRQHATDVSEYLKLGSMQLQGHGQQPAEPSKQL